MRTKSFSQMLPMQELEFPLNISLLTVGDGFQHDGAQKTVKFYYHLKTNLKCKWQRLICEYILYLFC